MLDDSHAKAARQPYNHLCVPEYTRARRNADLAVLERQRAREAHSKHKHAEIDHANTDGEIQVRPRKRKRAKKDSEEDEAVDDPNDAEWEAQRHRKRAKCEPSTSKTTTVAVEEEEEEETLDETLLAVIGILHAARVQSNIAGWLRAGSLLLLPPERADADDAAKVWFEEADLVREWARRGRDAMRELGLQVRHGVES